MAFHPGLDYPVEKQDFPVFIRAAGSLIRGDFAMNDYRFLALIGLGVLGVVMIADLEPAGMGQDQPKATLTDDLKELVQGNNEFAFDLSSKLSGQDNNLVFSPYSVTTALALAYAGARGETAERMAKALHFNLPQDRVHGAFKDLVADLQKDYENRPFELRVANALWTQHDLQLQANYVQRIRDYYSSALRQVDFRGDPEAARKIINRWVEEQTKGKIKELFGPGEVTSSSRVVLTNAIYFKASWLAPFDKKATKDEPFELAMGEKPLVPMMHHNRRPFSYFEGNGFQWLELPYQGDRLSMLVLLPEKHRTIAECEKALSSSVIRESIKEFRNLLGEVALPRFKMTSRLDLFPILAQLGIPGGPFDDIGGLSISVVVHKAFIDVNEVGTEAAAATGTGYGTSGAPPFSFRANRPFLFLIRDKLTGTILFRGHVTDPRRNDA
jgi:serine protease inhibitor